MEFPKAYRLFKRVHYAIERALTKFSPSMRRSYWWIANRVRMHLFPVTYLRLKDVSVPSLNLNPTFEPPPMPSWVIDEMRLLARDVDPALAPSAEFVRSCVYYAYPVIPAPGRCYARIASDIEDAHYTHCFAFPWLKRGGADLASIELVKAVHGRGGKCLVILTEVGDSPWRSRLPADVCVIDFAEETKSLSYAESVTVLTRLMVQLRPEIIHVINSRHAWQAIADYGKALSQASRMYASAFCDDVDEDGFRVGYARQFLLRARPYLKRVFSDNSQYPALLSNCYGYSLDMFRVVANPYEVTVVDPRRKAAYSNRILWAGRIDQQKMPWLLVSIAKQMSDCEFVVFGEPVLGQKSEVITAMRAESNIKLMGRFEGPESVPFDEFGVYLYTSAWDGTPFMVLSAAAFAIPTVASSVGGVVDVLGKDRGYLVAEINEPSAYVTALRRALGSPGDAQKRANAAREYVKLHHSKAAFLRSLAEEAGYLPGAGGCGAGSREMYGAQVDGQSTRLATN
jgi:glycosyltransferase involved in cell wall biosynthesis